MSITIDGQPILTNDPIYDLVVKLWQQRASVRMQRYGTVLIQYAPKDTKVSVWKKVAEVGD